MLHEQEIIGLIGRLTAQQPGITPGWLSNDAYWEPETRRIYTTDMLVENRHFRLDYFSPADVGWRAAAVNISDIAGMGGQPQFLLVSLALPDTLDLSWVEGFYTGLLAACQQTGAQVVGGDTVGSDQLAVNITAIGLCPKKHTIGQRNGAKPGDLVIATGWHGLSQVGLLALQQHEVGYQTCKAVHRRPQPRVEEGLALSAAFDRYALMDSSDGLADALIKIAQASGVKVLVDTSQVPLHPEVAAYADVHGLDSWSLVFYGGEDFELVATIPPAGPVPEHFTVIGRVESADDGPGAWFRAGEDKIWQALSLDQTYQHFGTPTHAGQ